MPESVYVYDGSFPGFLCCIFDSYLYHEIPVDIVSQEAFSPSLYPVRDVKTDRQHAQRVYHRAAESSPEAAALLYRGFLTCMEGRETALYRLMAKLLREGPGFLKNRADETLYPVWKAVRHLNGEVHLLKGFLRFSEFSGVLAAEIEPKNRVLPLLRPHFCDRFYNETFFIYDRTHREALFYAERRAIISPLESFQMGRPDEREAGFRLLWKQFYNTIAIRERENPRLRMSNMPKRYWNVMTEFQDADYFVPAGISGPPDTALPPGRSPLIL